MVKKYVLFFILFIIGSNVAFGFSGGPPAERTGNPGETCGGTTCASNCHTSYSENEGSASFQVNLSASHYTPGDALDITISFANSSAAIYGFEVTAVDADGNIAGTFTPKDNTTQTEAYSGLYAAHTKTGTAKDQWTVQWNAPSWQVTEPITFYAAGNEANGDSSSFNDYIYTANASVTASSTPSSCEAESISASSTDIELQTGETREITVAVKGNNNCDVEGVTVKSKINKGKRSIKISPEKEETDDDGNAIFTITAKKKGNAKVTFKAEKLKTKIKIKVVE
ncbi:choice-of-anchor V domain-containing protein [Candidatus Kuenenia sp.]|uniref:choice-of-anchor V domain-containing protein n=1 Tax=Candidatus Kuenenia sp. TaxID=2499824 RepID=UPI00322064D5